MRMIHVLVEVPTGALHKLFLDLSWHLLWSPFSYPNAQILHFITTSAPSAPDSAQLLSLNCIVLRVNEKSSEIFTVKIPKTENISILKDLIKEKQSHHLNHVNASEITLSQVSLPVDDLEEGLKNIDLKLKSLNPLLPLSQVFPRVEGDRLHIVVQVPTNGETISAFLHVTDNLVDIVLLLPSLINFILPNSLFAQKMTCVMRSLIAGWNDDMTNWTIS
jgi:Crinkler effector protein N-terminal domain